LLPAVAQGILAIEGRSGDPVARDVAALSCPRAATSAAAERAFLAGLEGDCNVPLAALAEEVGAGRLRLRVLLSSLDGGHVLRHESESPEAGAARAGAAAAEAILGKGGDALLASLRAEAGA
jgi:hydroxymethylbilane synthase